MNVIDKFIDQLIVECGYGDADAALKFVVRQDISQRLDNFLIAAIVYELSDEEVEQLDQLADRGISGEEIGVFASNHIPDFINFLAATLAEFRDVFLHPSPTG